MNTNTFTLKNGLTGNTLKIIGIILMVFDHLHQMFMAQGIPNWFSWIGRPVLPLFLFMCAEGFYHTRNRKRYFLQLFIGYILMNAINFFLSVFFYIEGVELINNVFSTLSWMVIYLFFVELLRNGIKEKKPGKIVLSIILMFAGIGFSLLTLILPPLVSLFVPSLLLVEGGFTAVLLGILFYVFREKRLIQILILAGVSALSFYSSLNSGYNVQWMMVFAIIPFLLYNGERGKGSKYFFYIFYPAHIYIFYAIAWLLQSKT